ncbi:MAG: TetR/AcrR family transcriptional regulator [Mycobacteriales bacterium]
MPRVSEARLAATRRQILDGARRAFAAHGFEGATVRTLEAEIGLSRGAIFHHFPDKDALFLALAREDAEETALVVAQHGLVAVMRELADRDAGWLGVQLEVARRLRTDPMFRKRWSAHLDTLYQATRDRLVRQRRAGNVRSDVPVDSLATLLLLVYEGLLTQLAAGLPPERIDGVLDLVEDSVRTTTNSRKRKPA